MKRLLLLLTIILTVIQASGARNKVFQDVAGLPGVETVVIGKAAIQMVKKPIFTGDQYIPKDAIRKIDGVEIVTATNDRAIETVHQTLQRVLNDGGYEPLIESNDNEESSAVYTILATENEEEGICHNILIVSEDSWELNIVLVKGDFEIAKIVSGNITNMLPD